MKTRREILSSALSRGIHGGVTSNGSGVYTCHACGEVWRGYRRTLWWPIRLHWGAAFSSVWFRRHFIGHYRPNDRIEQMVLTQVWHLGRLKIILGTSKL